MEGALQDDVDSRRIGVWRTEIGLLAGLAGAVARSVFFLRVDSTVFDLLVGVRGKYRVLEKRIQCCGALQMYAVIQTGGKQYRVKEGETLKVETLDAETGHQVEFDSVLLIQSDSGIKVGKPYVEGGKVTATVKSHGRHKKVHIIKFRRRKHYMKRAGHRQNYTEIQITGISG